MKITINNNTYEYPINTSLEEISKDFNSKKFYCARVNNRLRDLSYKVDKDCKIEFYDINHTDSMRIYQATLRYVIAMALHNIYPELNIRFSNSISMCYFAKIIGKTIDQEMLSNIEKEVKRIISLDLKLERKKYPIDEMINYYKSMNYLDKVETLKYRKEDVNIFECNGYRNYMYSYLTPSTGYISDFNFILYNPGFMIQFPRYEEDGYIPQFKDEPNFLKTLAQANKWANITDSENIYDINKKCLNEDELTMFIGECEAKQNHEISIIGERIEKDIENIRLVAIAGPSSSGKTTFSKKVEIELRTRNIKPLRISLDNYYLPSSKVPIDKEGKPDFEHIESLNIELFNDNMQSLISGKPTRLPIFDFSKKETVFTEPKVLNKDSIIIIEGIHALNDRLTRSIPRQNKFNIYIVPLSQRNIDNHNPISLTDLRLVRRIVRDKNFRSTSCLRTLETWKSVRNGERIWIYPFMENADYIFNSELGFELLVLKKYGMEQLKSIPNDSLYYIRANRLMKFLKVFNDIDDEYVYNNSLLREFIGGSVFKDT